jgi:hypothetical protein
MIYRVLCIFAVLPFLFGCEYARMYDQPNPRPTKIVQQKNPKNTIQHFDQVLTQTPTKNPFEATIENMDVGSKAYRSYCFHCHGADFKGHTQVADGFPLPPTDLNAIEIKVKPDSSFYRHIFYGGVYSPALGAYMSEEEIWKVILFVKAR